MQCHTRSGNLIGALGREGEGPGEFRFPRAVVRAADQSVAVLDPLASRATIFKATGEIVSQVSLPGVFQPLTPIGETALGTYEPEFLSSDKVVLAEIEVPGGRTLSERDLIGPPGMGLPAHCGLQWGAMSEEGVAVFGACKHLLLFYSADVGGRTRVVQAPTYVAELPSHRDIEDFRDGAGFLYRDGTVPPAAVRQFAETPKADRIVDRAMTYDAHGRLWVGTARDRDRHSYFDLYVDTVLAGSVQVRDRLMGFDILNNVLVTLVDRPLDEADAHGVPDRGVDWYDLAQLDREEP